MLVSVEYLPTFYYAFASNMRTQMLFYLFFATFQAQNGFLIQQHFVVLSKQAHIHRNVLFMAEQLIFGSMRVFQIDADRSAGGRNANKMG